MNCAAMSNSGGPVFPIHGYTVDASGALCGQVVQSEGATLRDLFAGIALLGVTGIGDADKRARLAYAQADAMLRARNEGALPAAATEPSPAASMRGDGSRNTESKDTPQQSGGLS